MNYCTNLIIEIKYCTVMKYTGGILLNFLTEIVKLQSESSI